MRLLALLVLVAACGGTQHGNSGLDERIEIANLWTQIRQWRSEAKMDLDPPTDLFSGVRDKSVREIQRKACPESQSVPLVCNDICSIADNICDNAERICELSLRLKNDSFAEGKCSSAKASCHQGKQRCCGCANRAATEASTR